MKKLVLFLMLLSVFIGFSQNRTTPEGSFILLNNQDATKAEFYTKSISKADLETWRLKDKRVVLDFKNGFQCELLSAKELFLQGKQVDMNAYQEAFEPNTKLPLFVVMESGWLGIEVSTNSKYSGK